MDSTMKFPFIIIFALLMTAMIFGCSVEKVKTVNPLMKFLPAENDIHGWAMIDTAEIYDRDGLWVYIDGGAEQYLKYGFEQVLTCEYADSLGTGIVLEIFEMTDSAAAAGIYGEKSNDSGKIVGLGFASSLQDYYLNFVNDRYLVTLTGFETGSQNLNGLIKIAAAVDDKIKDAQKRR